MAHIILFENINFHGAHKHVVYDEPNLNASDDNFFNDRVSHRLTREEPCRSARGQIASRKAASVRSIGAIDARSRSDA